MDLPQRLIDRLDRRLLSNIAWYGSAEIASRLTRLVTTVVLARLLSSTELGVAAAALTCFELIRVLANTGIGQAVIRAPAETLAATCNTAHRLVWFVCGGIAALQTAVGLVVAAGGWGGRAGLMVAVLSAVYLVMAPGLVPVYLILRANRLRVTATIAAQQVAADNLLTAVLAFAGFGAWAVVLPKLIVAPIWLIGVRRAQKWQPDPLAGEVPARAIWRFAAPVLGSEILTTLRLNVDNLLVGGIVGLSALGTYYFAFNAGIGFSLSLTGALSTAFFPHLAECPNPTAMLRRFDRALLTVTLPAALLIAVQAAASLFSVPLVFGARWADAAPLVALLCLSAVTRPLSDSATQLLRAANRPSIEFAASIVVTGVYLGAFAIGLMGGLMSGVAVIAVVATLLQLTYAIAARSVVASAARISEI
jgi:O-antigen/teichoic acid export membrane protein